MPWIERDGTNAITGIFNIKQPGVAETEWLEDNDPAVIAFRAKIAPPVIDQERLGEIRASTYVTNWDTVIKGKSFTEIKALFDAATAQQKSDLLLYLLLLRAIEVKE